MNGKPTVPEVLPKVRKYYAMPGNGAGGCLHIVLDDGNVLDHHVRYCLDWAFGIRDIPGVELAELLLRMSKTQRRKIHNRIHAVESPKIDRMVRV